MLKYIVFVALSVFYFINISTQDKPNLPLTPKCLGCICEAISGCNTTRMCSGDVCGAFRLTWAYWADGDKPTVGQQASDDPTAYANCANDPYCAAAAVQKYMFKFYQDCNGDNVVDCHDFAAIHKLGGYGCHAPLPDFYTQRFQQCKEFIGGSFV
ncbi:hypothetical protein RN001_013522 [Aquatica leii]|uniref:lysozyme n=1 Tax=Aquatica leii TaxID=1421715 RepID=A0AAN7PRV5_9COLE|nr:hypothetical protein RN001_013522 [Aquatica leii]